jgi:hypothetical protein
MPPGWLIALEESLAADQDTGSLAVALVVLAAVAGGDVSVDDDEAVGAGRRALLLLAAGGDPSRGLDLNGRAVTAMSTDLDRPERRATLERGMLALRQEAAGLPHVSEAVHGLLATPDVAWRAFSCSLLAEQLDAGES